MFICINIFCSLHFSLCHPTSLTQLHLEQIEGEIKTLLHLYECVEKRQALDPGKAEAPSIDIRWLYSKNIPSSQTYTIPSTHHRPLSVYTLERSRAETEQDGALFPITLNCLRLQPVREHFSLYLHAIDTQSPALLFHINVRPPLWMGQIRANCFIQIQPYPVNEEDDANAEVNAGDDDDDGWMA